MAEKKEEKPVWDRKLRHHGVFTDFRQRAWPAYMEFSDTDDPKTRGWKLFCTATQQEFKPGIVFLAPEHLISLKLKLKLTGKTEDASKPLPKAISKKKRNAAIAAAAPKDEDDE